jgi:hypothetical protein
MPSKLFLLLLFFFSCQFEKSPKKEIALFESKLFLSLATTYRAKIINFEYINSKEPITRPFFTAQPIVEFEAIGDNGNSKKIFCLIYRVPSRKGDGGWLKLTDSACGIKNGQTQIKLPGVKELFLGLSSNFIDSPLKGKKIKPFHLELIFQKNSNQYVIEIPLLNLSKEEIFLKESKKLRPSSVSNIRFSNGIVPSYAQGMIFFPLLGENSNGLEVKMTGKTSDNYQDGSSKICHQVNKKCESVVEFSCDQCRYGWFEVVPTSCALTGDKYCGMDKCGEKGYPACFRGFKYGQNYNFSGCDPENNAGFCQSGLNTICDAKGVLICD